MKTQATHGDLHVTTDAEPAAVFSTRQGMPRTASNHLKLGERPGVVRNSELSSEGTNRQHLILNF